MQALNERFIVMVPDAAQYGWFGNGDTLESAERAARAAARRPTAARWKARRVYRFTAALPFAPYDRDATENEADAWVGRDGSINWVRCDREKLEPAEVGR